jgi:hypothetical protein
MWTYSRVQVSALFEAHHPTTLINNGQYLGVTSITYESRLASSVSWQEDYNHGEQKKKTALPGANSSQNLGS